MKGRGWARTAYQLSTVVNGANRSPYMYGIGHVAVTLPWLMPTRGFHIDATIVVNIPTN